MAPPKAAEPEDYEEEEEEDEYEVQSLLGHLAKPAGLGHPL